MQITRASLSLRVFFALAACCSLASASPILFSGTQGNLAASALFENTTTNFTLTLTNLGTTPTADDSQTLMGVFFTLSGGKTLEPVSASIPSDQGLVQAGPTDLAANVGANWGYEAGLSPYLVNYGGGNQGVSAAGLGPFSTGNFCSSPGCGITLDGQAWGLVSPSFNAGDGNEGMDKHGPYVRNSIVFTFQPVSADVSVSNVYFQYSTALGGGGFPADAPEPSAIVLTGIGCGLLAAGLIGRRKRATSK